MSRVYFVLIVAAGRLGLALIIKGMGATTQQLVGLTGFEPDHNAY